MNTPPTVSALKLAFAAERRRAEAGAADPLLSEPVAIIGIGCRFPGGVDSPEAFWRILAAGTEVVREIPPERWPIDDYYHPDPRTPGKMNTRRAGMLEHIDRFDAAHFGIAPREAAAMDPQQRLLLEVTWDALNHAGRPPESLGGTATGVFFAIYNADYGRLQLGQPDLINAHSSSGTSHGISAGRVSYLLNLHGPSLAVDTACSSSLVAIHLACQSLRTGESSLAVAGGVSALLTPEETVSLSQWGMLAPDGRCKTFDAAANGFVRGEGCGVIVLKRLADALADGDRIHALIRGSAVNQDGRSTVLTAPNGLAQQAVLRQALANARIAPTQVTYVEAHGTGTALGDPIEVEALAAVVGRPRADGSRCRLGSVKTNLGHLEAAAGVAGLIKVVLAMQHGQVPPHLHFKTLNPMISLDGTCLEIGAGACAWPASAGPRVAGVSSFGFGGTNAHVVLEEAPRIPDDDEPPAPPPPWMLPLTARTSDALREAARNMIPFLGSAAAIPGALYEVCCTAALKRHHHTARLAVTGADAAELAARLQAHVDQTSPAAVAGTRTGGLAFVFCGHGAHWIGMGRALLAQEPVFRRTMEACDASIQPLTGWSVAAELAAGPDRSRLDETAVLQPVLFTVQTALVALLEAWGIRPDAVLGHSVGEIAAAHCAGALSLADAARISVLRGRLMQELAGEGAMAAVELSVAEARERVLATWPGLVVAAVNAPRSITLSGDATSIDAAVAALTAQQVFARRLSVNRAFHSPSMAAAARELGAALSGLRPAPARVRLFSSVHGAAVPGESLDAAYWSRNISDPVNFSGALAAALHGGADTFLEIGPHPVLATALRQGAAAAGKTAAQIATLRRSQPERPALLEAAAQIFSSGRSIEWKALFPRQVRPVSLPPYPWQRERHWAEAAAPAVSTSLEPTSLDAGRWPGRRLASAFLAGHVHECAVSASRPEFVREHVVCGVTTLPAAALVDLALAAGRRGSAGAAIASMAIDQALVLPDGADRIVQVGVESRDGYTGFRIFSRPASTGAADDAWILHASGRFTAEARPLSPDAPALEVARRACGNSVSPGDHYAGLAARGLDFGPQFRGVAGLWIGANQALARIEADLRPDSRAEHAVHPAVLDACLQASSPLVATEPGPDGAPAVFLPLAFESIVLPGALPSRLWVHARRRPSTPGPDVLADLTLFADDGAALGSILGLRLTRTTRERVRALVGGAAPGWLYAPGWDTLPAVAGARAAAAGRCLVVAGRCPAGRELARRLGTPERPCVLATWVAEGGEPDHATRVFDLAAPEQLAGILAELSSQAGAPLAHVIHLGALDLPAAEQTPAGNLSEAQHEALAPALALAQALSRTASGPSPRLWLVTRAASAAPAAAAVDPSQAPLHGLGHTLALELPALRTTVVDLLTGDPAALPLDALAAEILADGPETRVALAHDRRLGARLRRLPPPTRPEESRGESVSLRRPASGVLDEIAWHPHDRRPPGRDEVEIEVSHAGINFRDVLTALQVVAGPTEGLGGECAGRIVAVGEGVAGLAIGDEVIAFALGSLARHVTVRADLVIPRPRAIDPAPGAALPVVFLTAIHALRRIADLQRGQRVLIHAATGGVGSAAVQLARLAGAEIFATAGSEEKRALLRSWGVRHVFDSRSLDFATQIEAEIGPRGLDVVLNSLAGAFVPRSLGLVRPGGWFIELGKRDLLEAAAVARDHDGVRYAAFDLAEIAVREPAHIRTLFEELSGLLASGAVGLPSVRLYAAADAPEAFRFMAQGLHIGKLVLDLGGLGSAPTPVRADAAYIVTGGLGALGMIVARWLLAQGANRIFLLGRRPPDTAAAALVAKLREGGAHVETLAVDTADATALARALETIRARTHSIRGVFHAAGALDDGTVAQLSWARFVPVLRPKLEGAWNLHRLTLADPLDFFVLFSSAASLLGSPGQANYAAANAFLDALAQHRRTECRTALSINWGAWSEGGMAAQLSAAFHARLEARGMRAIAPADGIDALAALAAGGPPQVLALPVDWARYVRALPGGTAAPWLQPVAGDARPSGSAEASAVTAATLPGELAALPATHRLPRLTAAIERLATQALGLPPGRTIDPRQPLRELGLDSLMSVDLRNALAAALGRPLAATLLFDFPTIEALSDHLARTVLALDLGSTSTGAPAPERAEVKEIAQLSEAEAESLLLAELNQPKK